MVPAIVAPLCKVGDADDLSWNFHHSRLSMAPQQIDFVEHSAWSIFPVVCHLLCA